MRTFALKIILLFFTSLVWAAQSYQVNVGQAVDINEHGVCRKVTNSGAPLPIFISTNTAGEWSNFYSSASIPGVSIGACAPSVTCGALNRPAGQCSFSASPQGDNSGGWCGSGYRTCECFATCQANGTWNVYGDVCVPTSNLCP